jgi:hypothetical protein
MMQKGRTAERNSGGGAQPAEASAVPAPVRHILRRALDAGRLPTVISIIGISTH